MKQNYSFGNFQSKSPTYSKHKIVSAEDMKEHPFDQSVKPINVDSIIDDMMKEFVKLLQQGSDQDTSSNQVNPA